MYQLISFSTLVKVLASITCLVVVVLLLYIEITDSDLTLKHLFLPTSIVALMVFLIGGTEAWRCLWRKWPAFSCWVYPDINGVWAGTIDSNWSIIERLIEAAKNKGDTFDPENDELSQDSSPGDGNASPKKCKRVDVYIRVKASWFSINLSLETKSGYSSSESIKVMPSRAQGAGNPRLYYIYRNITRVPKQGDSSCHDGAAWLEIIADSMEMRGLCWTNREWTSGKNTAGEIKLVRICEDPNADLSSIHLP